jgi:dehydrogenase/reductase SDR family protein 7B
MQLNDKTFWITGASSGIGAELARQLAARGARLVLTARNEAALKAVQEDCLRHSVDCQLLPADLLDAGKLEALTQAAIDQFGVLHGVIFSAGQSQRSLAIETDIQVYRHLMELNFFAPIAITRYLLPYFKEKGGGHLVAISSIAGLMGFPQRTGYAASKHALKGYFETLQTEHEIPGLHITLVSPGRVQTPISVRAITGNGSTHGKMDEGQLKGLPVTRCAEMILGAMIRGRRHLLITQEEKWLWWIWWFCRPLYYRIAREKGRQN